jgi:hypothetical protein
MTERSARLRVQMEDADEWEPPERERQPQSVRLLDESPPLYLVYDTSRSYDAWIQISDGAAMDLEP